MSKYVWMEKDVVRVVLPDKFTAEMVTEIFTEYAQLINPLKPGKVIVDVQLTSLPRDKDESIKNAFVHVLKRVVRKPVPGDRVALVLSGSKLIRIGVRAILVLTGESHAKIFDTLANAEEWVNS